RDHGTHDEYRTEWWYYTGHLTTDDGTRYGFELTFFRVGVAAGSGQQAAGSRWEFHNLSLTHFAISDVAANDFRFYAKLNRYASHYYSMTRLEVRGTINGRRCRGLAWMDHEFGSSALRENQQGWDWFSVQLDNDSELMLYQMRRADGTPDLTSSGSLITSDGE